MTTSVVRHELESDAAESLTTYLHADAHANRAARKYSRTEQIRRVLWAIGGCAFRFSPRPLFAWRRMVLRLFGARVGKEVHVYPTTRFYMPWNVEIGSWSAIGENVLVYSLGKVRIGTACAISHGAHLCAGSHDFSDPKLPLIKPPITLDDCVWVGADAFIGPNVKIEAGAIIGARAVIMKNVKSRHVMVGNPARTVRIRTEFT